ncbi:MAG: DUF3656 domain-containing protein [Acutalibacteraceae bacterium]|nr:DUF3656 domain-containing protein [Acutalibacteraceae bacterium]
MNRIEILAPAGGFDSVISAVRSGADAVYLGEKSFSARASAQNFDDDELKKAVAYCHIHGVKVYVTINTLIFDDEFEKLKKAIISAAEADVDALIVQNQGVARLAKKLVPDLPLHASTQMSVHTASGVRALYEMGFKRVVLSREMSREEIKKAAEVPVELEVFVHGALCMCVSGQCLLSSVLGARSGNRGLCAGPCRLPFKASGGTGYDLSLKDLSLVEYIDELVEMGVASLKIEGRMKRPEYIAAATAACRQALDNGYAQKELIEALGDVFSRSGFTDGYYKSVRGRNMFGIRTRDDVTASKEAFSYLHGIYRNERQSVPVTITARIHNGKPIKLEISDGKNTACAQGDIPELAQKAPTERKTVEESLKKLGGTPYYAEKVNVDIDDGLFVRGATLNELRRNAIDKLNRIRATVNVQDEIPVNLDFTDIKHRDTPYIIARFEDNGAIPDNISADAVILPMNCSFENNALPLIAETPRYITDEGKIYNRLCELSKQGVEYVYCHNIATVEIAARAGMKIIASPSLNIANSASAQIMKKLDVSAVTLSAEISLRDAVNLPTNLPKGIFAYGRLPLMLLRNCPLKNGRVCKDCDKHGFLTDRKGIKFPIACHGEYVEMLNSTPVYLADKVDELRHLDFVVLSFYDEASDTVQKTVKAYKNGAPPPAEYTRGLYFRELL